MTAWGTKAPRTGRKVKVCMTQPVKHSDRRYTIHSLPYPIHTAEVTRDARGGWWTVKYPTIPGVGRYVYDTWDTAMRNASETIGRKAGADLDRFTRAQAYAVGLQRCPYQPDRAVPKCCEQTPEVGTVWCLWHPGGKDPK